jgi:ABC-2 type transport system ATP-binding protein
MNMIEITGLTRSFGALKAVDGLDLSVAQGEIFGLVGPDGAGKTTALRTLCGLLDPTAGTVKVGGLDVGKNVDAVKDQLGYMAQRFGLYGDLTVEENLNFYGDLFGVTGKERDDLTASLLQMTRMTPFRDRPAAKLSGGMKQKLALMCTLLHHPKVLVLDEPTNGVDPVSRRDFWEILYRLAKEGMTVLVTTAYLDESERCDRVALMHKGRIVRMDTPEALKNALAPTCFALDAENLRGAREWLNHQGSVISAETAGAALHVYLAPGADPKSLEQGLAGAGLGPAALRLIAPAMEDVFIAQIRTEERNARN